MTIRSKTIATFLVTALLVAAPYSLGQTVTATLTGTIADSSGAAVPGASVILTNQLSGDVRKTISNGSGYYALPAIPAATYALSVEAAGFQKSEIKGVVLNSADQRNVNVSLQVGAVSETVRGHNGLVTTTVAVPLPVAPRLSVTVNVTMKVPAAA